MFIQKARSLLMPSASRLASSPGNEADDEITEESIPKTSPMDKEDPLYLIYLWNLKKKSSLEDLLKEKSVSMEQIAAVDESGKDIIAYLIDGREDKFFDLFLENTDLRNAHDFLAQTLLYTLICDFDDFKYLITRIPEWKSLKNDDGYYLMHCAVGFCDIDQFRQFTTLWKDFYIENEIGQSPFDIAKEFGQSENLEWMCECVQRGEVAAKNGDTALHLAVKYSDDDDDLADTLRKLFRFNSPLDQRNDDGKTVLELEMNEEIRELFEDELRYREKYPLHCIVRSGDSEALKAWIAENKHKISSTKNKSDSLSPLEEKDSENCSLIHLAAKSFSMDKEGQIIPILLSYLPEKELSQKDKDGKTVLDYLKNIELHQDNASNANLAKVIHAVCRKGKLLLHANQIIAPNKKESELVSLASKKNMIEVNLRLKNQLPSNVLNAVDDRGNSTLHYTCMHKKTDTLKLLLKQKYLQLDINNFCGQSALSIASDSRYHEIVKLLIQAGADVAMEIPNEIRQELEEGQISAKEASGNFECHMLIIERYEVFIQAPAFYLVNGVPNMRAVREHNLKEQTPLHVAMLSVHSNEKLHKICQTTEDINKMDNEKETPLLVATKANIPSNISFLLDQGADVTLRNKKNETALMIAAKNGHVEAVRLLLNWSADADDQDKEGKSALVLAAENGHTAVVEALLPKSDISIKYQNGLTLEKQLQVALRNNESPKAQYNKPSERTPPLNQIDPEVTKQIIKLLQMEAAIRENSTEYQEKLALKLVTMPIDKIFRAEHYNELGFAKAVECGPVLAQTLLDNCVELNRHEAVFNNLEAVYGVNPSSSALHAVLNLDTKDPDLTFQTKKTCLEHVVFERILAIKWELFGQRMYYEQLSMNILLLLTMSTSSLLYEGKKVPPLAFVCCIFTVAWVGIFYTLVQLMRPQYLWNYVRNENCYGRALSLAERKKKRVRHLFFASIVFALLVTIPIVVAAQYHDCSVLFIKFNHIVLWLTALYFFVNECQEMRVGVRKYMCSHTNKAQFIIYILILFVFLPMKMSWIYAEQPVQVGLGSFISLALWILSLQFLEVVPSASYLLPMMSNLIADVWNFFLLFGVFQFGLTITFYLIFREKNDDHAFNTLGESFISTYFVAFGELTLDSLQTLDNPNSNDPYERTLYTGTAILMMLHSAIIAIVLLNALIAMMNKTVDGGLENAKTEARISYARCILRFEQSMGLDQTGRNDLLHLKVETRQQETQYGNQRSSQVYILNPIFNEHVSKVNLDLSVKETEILQKSTTDRQALHAQLDDLVRVIDKELNNFKTALTQVQDYTEFNVDQAFSNEFKLIQLTKANLNKLIENAKRNLGPYRHQILIKFLGLIKRELVKFKETIRSMWKTDFNSISTDSHMQCCILYQLAHRSTGYDQGNKVMKAIVEAVKNITNPKDDNVEDSENTKLKEEIAHMKKYHKEKIDGLAQQLTNIEKLLKMNLKINMPEDDANDNEITESDFDFDSDTYWDSGLFEDLENDDE